MLLATIAAVVVAPIVRRDHLSAVVAGLAREVGGRATRSGAECSSDAEVTNATTTAERTLPSPTNFIRCGIDESSRCRQIEPPNAVSAVCRLAGCPSCSARCCLALAHFGYGPEPVPLFVLALFLGYVYQRTHRILPCIVAHALFNLFSMIVLWRMVLRRRRMNDRTPIR